MPHLTLEYTDGLPAGTASRELFLVLHGILADVAGVDIGNCKSRAVARQSFLVADGVDEAAFVHLDVRILEGRPHHIKVEVGRRMLEVVRAAYSAAGCVAQITVEIGDIARDFYFKAVTEESS